MLSDSTEAYDRGAKAAHYRRIPALRESVLVSQNEPRIEVHRRNEHGRFEVFEAGPNQDVELTSVGVTIDSSSIYENPLA